MVMQMQDASTSPWIVTGGDRKDFINKIKLKDAETQCDGPP